MIVGYTYQVADHCEDCLRKPALTGSAEAGAAMSWGDCGSTEDILAEWAGVLGLDRDDEKSFDSADFPKVITRQQAEHAEGDGDEQRCSGCGLRLLEIASW
jgi:hypothetical protein